MQNIKNNHNRKIAILKLKCDENNELYFNESCVITYKISCIQYLLLKYGLTLDSWQNKGLNSNWIGFNYLNKCSNNKDKSFEDICCLVYPIHKKLLLNSVGKFNQLKNNNV